MEEELDAHVAGPHMYGAGPLDRDWPMQEQRASRQTFGSLVTSTHLCSRPHCGVVDDTNYPR